MQQSDLHIRTKTGKEVYYVRPTTGFAVAVSSTPTTRPVVVMPEHKQPVHNEGFGMDETDDEEESETDLEEEEEEEVAPTAVPIPLAVEIKKQTKPALVVKTRSHRWAEYFMNLAFFDPNRMRNFVTSEDIHTKDAKLPYLRPLRSDIGLAPHRYEGYVYPDILVKSVVQKFDAFFDAERFTGLRSFSHSIAKYTTFVEWNGLFPRCEDAVLLEIDGLARTLWKEKYAALPESSLWKLDIACWFFAELGSLGVRTNLCFDLRQRFISQVMRGNYTEPEAIFGAIHQINGARKFVADMAATYHHNMKVTPKI